MEFPASPGDAQTTVKFDNHKAKRRAGGNAPRRVGSLNAAESSANALQKISEGLQLNGRVLELGGLNLNQLHVLRVLVPGLRFNRNVEVLGLSFNRLGNEGVRVLADALYTNSTLHVLHLDHNGIGNSGLAFLSASIKVNAALTHLILHDNNITEEGASALADALRTNTTLHTIWLGGNEISDMTILQTLGTYNSRSGVWTRYIHSDQDEFKRMKTEIASQREEIDILRAEVDHINDSNRPGRTATRIVAAATACLLFLLFSSWRCDRVTTPGFACRLVHSTFRLLAAAWSSGTSPFDADSSWVGTGITGAACGNPFG